MRVKMSFPGIWLQDPWRVKTFPQNAVQGEPHTPASRARSPPSSRAGQGGVESTREEVTLELPMLYVDVSC